MRAHRARNLPDLAEPRMVAECARMANLASFGPFCSPVLPDGASGARRNARPPRYACNGPASCVGCSGRACGCKGCPHGCGIGPGLSVEEN